MRLADLVRPEQVSAKLETTEKLEVLKELANLLGHRDSQLSKREYYRVLVEREQLRTTGVGSGVAIPHGKVPGLDQLSLAVGLSRKGIDFEAADDKPVHIFMALVAPVSSTGDHLKALARIARLCSNSAFRERLLACETDEEAYETLVTCDEKNSHP